jgi:OOP family OmpA-OmpF porin
MNYFTIKKVVALSLLSVLGITAANAQDASSSAKVFGGSSQYRTWSVGLNAGVLAPVVATGGTNDFDNWDANLGYGATLRKQLGHAFGIEASFLGGKLSGDNDVAQFDRLSYETKLSFSGALSAVVNVATADFLKRENAVNFTVKAGYGLGAYKWTKVISGSNTDLTPAGGYKYGTNGKHDNTHEAFIPVGVGAKFKISDRVNFDLGYTMYFLDGDKLDATFAKAPSKDKWSYTSAGVEFSLGSTAKPNLDWVNPVAMMYDELKDPSLRQELEALKGRVTTLENTVNTLSADADGDGVANRFDKCPGTPAGTQVDGSGCPIKFPEPAPVAAAVAPMPTNQAVQFDFDSSVLKTSAYPVLDQQSAYLKSSGSTIELDGYASSEGTEAYNAKLSLERANAVKTYLVNSGVDAGKISVKGLGESNPVASNATEEGRVQNRRVEFKR